MEFGGRHANPARHGDVRRVREGAHSANPRAPGCDAL